jgi:hypothetical protein
MFGGGLGSDGRRQNRARSENAQATRAQLLSTWARKRESLRQWYLRLTGNKPTP